MRKTNGHISAHAGMLRLPGGVFAMGSEHHYPEEQPVRRVSVNPFWIDETPVTNTAFAAFVAETGYVTLAEKPPILASYPDTPSEMAEAGSLVFNRPGGPVDLDDYTNWWDFCVGADWRHPLGPDSTIDGLEEHPVVHVAYGDAVAYAAWQGKSLPTEAEWEYAARGGLVGAAFAWGDELAPGGAMLANYWQGLFPFANQLLDGWERTSPVGTYPPNGFGLFDMIGNVWEWTGDWYLQHRQNKKSNGKSCCILDNPRGGRERDSYDPDERGTLGRKVLKGGSHLCAPNYCQRYRPAARHPQTIDTSSSHIGFRCVVRDR
jgi:formylglycine-generating enzyme required for sulfatase activity